MWLISHIDLVLFVVAFWLAVLAFPLLG